MLRPPTEPRGPMLKWRSIKIDYTKLLQLVAERESISHKTGSAHRAKRWFIQHYGQIRKKSFKWPHKNVPKDRASLAGRRNGSLTGAAGTVVTSPLVDDGWESGLFCLTPLWSMSNLVRFESLLNLFATWAGTAVAESSPADLRLSSSVKSPLGRSVGQLLCCFTGWEEKFFLFSEIEWFTINSGRGNFATFA